MQDLARLFLSLLVIFAILQETVDARGGRRGAKGKGKNNLQFAQVAEFSLIQSNLSDPKAAHVTKGSHFSQTFRLGYKLLIICEAKGEPRPTIKWYKEGSEINPKPNIHYYERPTGNDMMWSKLEIDPATMGDQGIYACVANNERGTMAKNFKVEYSY